MRRLLIIVVSFLLLSLALTGLAAAAPPTAEFTPGTWDGMAFETGGISNGNVSASVAGAGLMIFEIVVTPDGTVTNGTWTMDPTTINESSAYGSATATMAGTGSLSGTGAQVTISGDINMTLSIPSIGSDSSFTVPASGQFSPSNSSCTFVQGDMATEARAAQQGAGFSTSVKMPFAAARRAGPGKKGNESWKDAYVKLVQQMTTVSEKPKPTVGEVRDLVNRIEQFKANLVATSSCSDAPKNFKKGKQPYTWFIGKFNEMMTKILSDPSGYSGADISEMLSASVQIGAVGSAAPDQAAAASLETMFLDTLGKKLDADISAGNRDDAASIFMGAAQAGFIDLAARAQKFAF